MSENQSYIYNIEFSIENVRIFNFPPELENPENLDFLIRFQMEPDVCMEITESEYIDTINCGQLTVKKVVFTLNEKQLECDPKACITAYLIKCPRDIVPVGCYDLPNFQCTLKEVKKKFDCNKCSKKSTPASELIKELNVIQDCDEKVAGSIHYIIRVNCFGPVVNTGFDEMDISEICEKYMTGDDGYGRIKGCTYKTEQAENECLSTGPNDDESPYDEYMAQVNGNQLIVRVTKDNFVTRVFDASSEENKEKLTVRGCDQQIDFKFPKNFTCCQCKKKFGNCKCRGDSDLTNHQRRTSCSGSSYKNSQALPVIRGNLKYPGRFEDQSVKFNLQDHRDPIDSTEKYKMKSQATRNVCFQADQDNFSRELNGMSKIPQGIQFCRAGCEDDVDVFVWKISQKRTDRNGKKNEIELEMRTPRGPKNEILKKETREVQVLEDEFEEIKKVVKKEGCGQKNGVNGSTNGGNGKMKCKEVSKEPPNQGKSAKVPGNSSKKENGNCKKKDPCQKKKPACK